MNGAAVIAEILRREGTEFLSCYPRNPLIEACAAACRQRGVDRLTWQTALDNATAQALYDSVGARRSRWLDYALEL